MSRQPSRILLDRCQQAGCWWHRAWPLQECSPQYLCKNRERPPLTFKSVLWRGKCHFHFRKQEQESEGDAQAMSSHEQPFLSRVGIALFMAAAVGGCAGAWPWSMASRTIQCPCVLRTAGQPQPRAPGHSSCSVPVTHSCWDHATKLRNYQTRLPQTTKHSSHKSNHHLSTKSSWFCFVCLPQVCSCSGGLHVSVSVALAAS